MSEDCVYFPEEARNLLEKKIDDWKTRKDTPFSEFSTRNLFEAVARTDNRNFSINDCGCLKQDIWFIRVSINERDYPQPCLNESEIIGNDTYIFQQKTPRILSKILFCKKKLFSEVIKNSIMSEIIVKKDNKYYSIIRSFNKYCHRPFITYVTSFDEKLTPLEGGSIVPKHNTDFFREKYGESFSEVFGIVSNGREPLEDLVDRFWDQYMITIPFEITFPEKFDGVLYRQGKDPMISGIEMIDLPIEIL